MTGFIHAQGAALASLGYRVCAIAPGSKRPMGAEWGEHPLSEEECVDHREARAGAGIICGRGENAIYGLDFDIEADAEFADDLADWLSLYFDKIGGALLKRTGKPPKFLIPVRGKAGMRKTATEFFRKGDAKARLEILGEGQQFVAYHIHPSTGEPYKWERISDAGMWSTDQGGPDCTELCKARPEDLAWIDEKVVTDIKAKFAELAEKHGWSRESRERAMNIDEDAALANELTPEQIPVGLSIAEAKKYIAEVAADDYDEWLAVGMALHFEFGGAPEALALWDEWSSKSESYKGFEDLQYRWERFGTERGRKSRTMRTYIARYNRTHVNPATELTERGLAARAANYYQGSLVYSGASSRWHFFDGKHWKVISEGFAVSLLWPIIQDELFKEMGGIKDVERLKLFQRFYVNSQKHRVAREVEKHLRYMPGIYIPSFNAKANYRYFGVANGDIDLETLELLPPLSSRFTAEASFVRYDPDAKCPLWEQTLLDALKGDADLVDYVQRIFGYAMLGNPCDETLPIFYGKGGNGKSTIINTVREIMGEAATTVEAETMTSLGGQAGPTAGGARADIVAMFGRRMVVVPETDQKARFKEAAVKRMVSTDELTARGLYCTAPERVKPTWVPIMMTNYLPRIDGEDEGIWRRIAAVQFGGYFSREQRDVHRAEKLYKEYPGILNWLLEGVRKYRERGLAQPASVVKDSTDYRTAMDVLSEFIGDRCELDADAVCPTSALFSAWEQFANRNGYGRLMWTKTMFSQRLKRRDIDVRPTRYEGRMQRCYVGIKLKDDFAEAKEDEEEDWIG